MKNILKNHIDDCLLDVIGLSHVDCFGPQYNVRGLDNYCKEYGISPETLTDIERKQFEINSDSLFIENDSDKDYLDDPGGPLVEPFDETIPVYNIRSLLAFCKKLGITPDSLSEEEFKQFEIKRDTLCVKEANDEYK